METWLFSKDSPFPCSCGPSGAVYPNLWAEKLHSPGLSHIPPLLACLARVYQHLVSLWLERLAPHFLAATASSKHDLICIIPCLIPPNP